jgi:hypothetical protein
MYMILSHDFNNPFITYSLRLLRSIFVLVDGLLILIPYSVFHAADTSKRDATLLYLFIHTVKPF